MTEDEKVEQQRKAKATKDRKKQKEKERTARARPAANFFNPLALNNRLLQQLGRLTATTIPTTTASIVMTF